MIKRAIWLILMSIIILILSSCNPEPNFIFNNHHFNDSIEQVQQLEGSNGELDKKELDGYKLLRYSKVKVDDFVGDAIYYFKENKLKAIDYFYLTLPESWTMKDKGKTSDDILVDTSKKVISVLRNTYGNIDREEKLKYGYKALWKKSNYGIVFINSEGTIFIGYSLDPNSAEKYYNTFSISDLLGE